jgi:hypothetical protein
MTYIKGVDEMAKAVHAAITKRGRNPDVPKGLLKVDIENIQMMLGVFASISRSEWGYKNHFSPCPEDVPSMKRLVRHGFAVEGEIYRSDKDGILHYYHATRVGCKLAGLSTYAARKAMRVNS